MWKAVGGFHLFGTGDQDGDIVTYDAEEESDENDGKENPDSNGWV